MKILLSKTETYVVENDSEAEELIREAKENNEFELAKYTNEAKVKKAKGEIIAEYNKVTLLKVYQKEKDLF